METGQRMTTISLRW